MTLLDKQKTAVPLAAMALGLVVCAALPVQSSLDSPVPAKAEPKPIPQGPNKILFYRAGYLTIIDPDGKNEKKVSPQREKVTAFLPGEARLSPGGNMLAVLVLAERGPRGVYGTLHIRGLDEKELGTNLGVECETFAWSPDGTEIACSNPVEDPAASGGKFEHFIVNIKTKEKTKLKLPDDHRITDWSRDGKYYLTTSIDGSFTPDTSPAVKLHQMNRDGTEHKQLTDGKTLAMHGRFSPDGKQVLFTEWVVTQEKPAQVRMTSATPIRLLDVATQKVTKIENLPANGEIQGYCWSPDGKQIAYCWREVHDVDPKEAGSKETLSRLVVCDADGKNAKIIATEKSQGQLFVTMAHVDWR